MTHWKSISSAPPGDSDKPSILLYSPAMDTDDDFPGHSVLVSNVDWANANGAKHGFTLWAPITIPEE